MPGGPVKSLAADHSAATSTSEPSAWLTKVKRKRLKAPSSLQDALPASIPDLSSMHRGSPGQALQEQQHQQEPQNEPSCTQQHSAKQHRKQKKKQKHIKAADDAFMPEDVPQDTEPNMSIRQGVSAAGIHESPTAVLILNQQQQRRQQAKNKRNRMQHSTAATEDRPQAVTASQVPSSNCTNHDYMPVPDMPPRLFEMQAQVQAGPYRGGAASQLLRHEHQKPSLEGIGPGSAHNQHSKASTSHKKQARLGKLEAQNTASPEFEPGRTPDAAQQLAGRPSRQLQQPLSPSRDQHALTPKQPQQADPAGMLDHDHSLLKSGHSERRKIASKQPQNGPAAASAGMQDGISQQASKMQHPQKSLSKRRKHAVRPQPSMGAPDQASQLSSQLADQDQDAQDHEAPAVPAHQSQGSRGAGSGKGRRGSGLLDQMRAKLSGGHFRWLNEQLYTTTGDAALGFMKANPSHFDEYHKVSLQALGSMPSSVSTHVTIDE